jgi:acyl dehydratase
LTSLALPRCILEAPRPGAKVTFSRTFTEADVALLNRGTWDANPYHTDDTFASQARFERRIAPGAGILTHLGGLWGFLEQRPPNTYSCGWYPR